MNDTVYQLQEEIINLIERYTKEGDLTIAELLGILELLKYRYIECTFPRKED